MPFLIRLVRPSECFYVVKAESGGFFSRVSVLFLTMLLIRNGFLHPFNEVVVFFVHAELIESYSNTAGVR
jgi:hypothetical protein